MMKVLIQANGFYIELNENNKNYFKYISKRTLVNLNDFNICLY